MDGAGKKLWGYYPTDKTWVPLQVDADGKVKVDLSAVKLDDLGDVSVPTPGDQYLLYWDAATSLWKCRVLTAADIPNLDAAKITTGILSPARVGPKIQDANADTSWDVEQSANEDKVHGKVKGVEAFLLDDAGVLTFAKQSAARVYRATTVQSIPNATWTKAQLDAKKFDIQNEYDVTTNYRFTAKTAGIYFGAVVVAFTWTSTSGELLALNIYKNGVAAGDMYIWPCGAAYAYVGTPFAFQLAVGDYLEVWVYQGTGSPQNLCWGERATWCFVVKVA